MFEGVTFESLLKRMIMRVSEDYPNVDIREGSIVYNALAPAAVELQNMYIELDAIMNETFADTASRENLTRRVAERGLAPYPATYSVLQGEFNIDVPIGSRFSLDMLNYIAVSKIRKGVFEMRCEMIGSIGNEYFGALVPVDYIEGLTSAQITKVIVPGEDEEDTERLRRRYFASIESQAFGGNVADYKEKVNKLNGVGGVKVYPVWNGGGTVKLVIIDSAYKKPSSFLIEYVQNEIDPVGHSGEGIGIAPVGHIVTVEGVEEKPVDILLHITYQAGWSWEDIKESVEEQAESYLAELAGEWAVSERLVVRISQIEARLLGIAGVLDIADTCINGEHSNLMLAGGVIPVKGLVEDG